ncbi:SoxR reducing system RseC family protein [Clostridium sp. D2Q-11]|uniref:SoxR reducing system RseC family protein n=1 Tax=Anaeromonas frigoriresistens TaxID=2683708 RepID=A0A942V203_9FIRM|nr:SoxR reducing system RseC family protein [Anaeromonas frigoriresistens]MBS4539697.1 SoxR reducing system RseC family protein [Anaeromonas frigoriresistens]
MDQIGYVIETKDDIAVVDVRRTTACGDKCSSCGGGCSVPAMRINIKNTIGAETGNFVEVEMETKSLMKSAFIAYVIPLIMLIVGISSGIYFFQSRGFGNYESLGLLTGLGFLGLSYFILKFIDNRIKNSKSSELKLVRVL